MDKSNLVGWGRGADGGVCTTVGGSVVDQFGGPGTPGVEWVLRNVAEVIYGAGRETQAGSRLRSGVYINRTRYVRNFCKTLLNDRE